MSGVLCLVKQTLHYDKGTKLMSKLKDDVLCNNLPQRDVKNANALNIWALVWAANLAILTTLPKFEWYSGPWLITLAFVLGAGSGIGMLLAFKRFLKELDEMERKIQFDALALSVGVTVVVFGGYSILEKAGVVPDLQASHLIVLLALAYIVGIFSGRARYR